VTTANNYHVIFFFNCLHIGKYNKLSTIL
jgi:hypothetical protein